MLLFDQALKKALLLQGRALLIHNTIVSSGKGVYYIAHPKIPWRELGARSSATLLVATHEPPSPLMVRQGEKFKRAVAELNVPFSSATFYPLLEEGWDNFCAALLRHKTIKVFHAVGGLIISSGTLNTILTDALPNEGTVTKRMVYRTRDLEAISSFIVPKEVGLWESGLLFRSGKEKLFVRTVQ